MSPNPGETADLVTFTEEILNEKLHFFAQWGLAYSFIISIFWKYMFFTKLDPTEIKKCYFW